MTVAMKTGLLDFQGFAPLNLSLQQVAEIYQLFTNITAFSVINARDGQDLRIMRHRSATETTVWPSNFRWIGNAAPAAFTAGTRNYFTLNYSSETGLWYECAARALGVPQT